MRFLGFLTGVSLLTTLFVIFYEPPYFSADNKQPKNNSGTTERTETTKNLNLEDPLAESSKHLTDKGKERAVVPTQKKPLATTANRKSSTRSEPSALAVDKRQSPQLPVISDPVVPDKSKTAVDAPPPLANPTIKIDKANDNDDPREPTSPFADGPLNHEIRWHHFWGPFNTRNSAQGFANNLAKRIAVEFKIIETHPGGFMVAFPYVSKENRQSTILLIEQRTGLTVENK